MPEWTEHLRARITSLSLSPAREAEIIEELSQHLEERYEELRTGGTTDADARRLAIEELLDRDALANHMRSLRQARVPPPITPGAPSRFLLDDLRQDMRYTNAHATEATRLRRRGGRDAGARHWRHPGDFQRRERRADQPAALSRFGPARSDRPLYRGHRPALLQRRHRRFGGDRAVLERVLTIDARPYQIIGVMPTAFRFDGEPDIILPLRIDRGRLIPAFWLLGVARLKPDVTLAQANADAARVLHVWFESFGVNPAVRTRWAPSLRPLKQDVVGDVGRTLWVLMGTIPLVLLMACANVANLLLVRADARQREFAIRAALGARWTRVARASFWSRT